MYLLQKDRLYLLPTIFRGEKGLFTMRQKDYGYMKDENGLTPKQALFVQFYCGESHLNACKAYKMAGYSMCKGWEHNAIKILHKDYIVQAINKKKAEIARKNEVSIQEIIDNARWLIKFGRDNNRTSAVQAGNEQLGRTIAAFTDNINTTDTQKQRELDEREEAEAERVAAVLNRERLKERNSSQKAG